MPTEDSAVDRPGVVLVGLVVVVVVVVGALDAMFAGYTKL
jgi:hypothetical protein